MQSHCIVDTCTQLIAADLLRQELLVQGYSSGRNTHSIVAGVAATGVVMVGVCDGVLYWEGPQGGGGGCDCWLSMSVISCWADGHVLHTNENGGDCVGKEGSSYTVVLCVEEGVWVVPVQSRDREGGRVQQQQQ